MAKTKHSGTTKMQQVRNHLSSKGTITSWEAIQKYGATRLSAIIYNLRHKEGWDIDSQDIAFEDRYGNVGTFAKYVLISTPKTSSLKNRK